MKVRVVGDEFFPYNTVYIKGISKECDGYGYSEKYEDEVLEIPDNLVNEFNEAEEKFRELNKQITNHLKEHVNKIKKRKNNAR